MTNMPDATPRSWHDISAEAALGALSSGTEGLSHDEWGKRLNLLGPNRLPSPKRQSLLSRILLHFHNVLIYVLLGSALITAVLGHTTDSMVILAVVLVNAVIGFVQEGKAEKAMEAIRNMMPQQAAVIRDGTRRTVDAEDLVPGDIVLLEAGDQVPADIRLLQAQGLQIQEAILTGESVPVEKHILALPRETSIGDRYCLAFSGTLVTSGFGRGLVVETGAETEIGKIGKLLSKVDMLTTPLVKQMNVFARWLTLVILSVAAAILVLGYTVGGIPFGELFMAVVGLSVAAIPEGLPAILTITLAVGVQAMARQKAIVRRLPAIETLGSVSVICSDKTGTLTRNEMMAVSVVTATHEFSLEGVGYAPNGAVRLNDTAVKANDHLALREFGHTAILCNDAALHEIEGKWVVEGDPMEGALLALAEKLDVEVKRETKAWTRTDSIPFDARYRYMATLCHDHENHAVIFVKGAPEQVLGMCRQQRSISGESESLDHAYWTEQAEKVAAQGQRVLALAVKSTVPEHTILEFSDVETGLTLVGLVGMIDPPRPEAIEAVAECQQAGIRVKMITGDHRSTAQAIGRQIGLQNTDSTLTGADLDRMDDEALSAAVLNTDIFARTSPEHKLRLVTALQKQGFSVAMTGDGVNDAPALKRADAGVAMGLKGSAAAKEAAELVLADDNFATIVAAVREGRTVYDNIKKVISWTLPTNAGEAMTIIVALLFGMTLPITPVQILWVNLITAVTLGVALAFEPTEANTMRRKPRAMSAPLLSGELAWHILLVSVLIICGVFGIYFYAINIGHSVDLARTMAVNTLVAMEIFHLFFIRNIYGTSLKWQAVKGTKVVWGTVLTVTFAQFAVTYLPPLQAVFATEAIPLVEGVLILGIGISLFVIVEVEKQIRLAVTLGRRGKASPTT